MKESKDSKTMVALMFAILLGGVIQMGIGYSCKPIPTPTPPVDAGVLDVVDAAVAQDSAPADDASCSTPAECACKNLCKFSCAECRDECVASIEKIMADRVMRFDVDCVQNAATKTQIASCPGIKCE